MYGWTDIILFVLLVWFVLGTIWLVRVLLLGLSESNPQLKSNRFVRYWTQSIKPKSLRRIPGYTKGRRKSALIYVALLIFLLSGLSIRYGWLLYNRLLDVPDAYQQLGHLNSEDIDQMILVYDSTEFEIQDPTTRREILQQLNTTDRAPWYDRRPDGVSQPSATLMIHTSDSRTYDYDFIVRNGSPHKYIYFPSIREAVGSPELQETVQKMEAQLGTDTNP